MARFQAVCFDLFNTLVSVGRVPEEVGRFTADILGMDREHWNEACFGPRHEICKPTEHHQIIRTLAHSIDPAIPDTLIRQATEARQRRFDHALRHVGTDVLEALAQLRARGQKLALISNASTGEVSAWRDSPLAAYFDVAVFSCECGYKKPETEIYAHTLQCLSSVAEATLFVGDGGSGEFLGAHSTGLFTVLSRQFLSPARYAKVTTEQGFAIAAEVGHVRELERFL